jgi:hypothetical protein
MAVLDHFIKFLLKISLLDLIRSNLNQIIIYHTDHTSDDNMG